MDNNYPQKYYREYLLSIYVFIIKSLPTFINLFNTSTVFFIEIEIRWIKITQVIIALYF